MKDNLETYSHDVVTMKLFGLIRKWGLAMMVLNLRLHNTEFLRYWNNCSWLKMAPVNIDCSFISERLSIGPVYVSREMLLSAKAVWPAASSEAEMFFP